MAQTALQLAKVTRSARWYGVARDCAAAVLQARFTSAQLLSTAYLCAFGAWAELTAVSSDAMVGLAALERDASAANGANGTNGADAYALDDLATQHAAAAAELIINGGGDTWAHGSCYSSHDASGVPWRGARPAPRNARDHGRRAWPQEAYGWGWGGRPANGQGRVR